MLTTTHSVALRAAEIVSEYFSAPISALEQTAQTLGGQLAEARSAGQLTAAQLDLLVEPHAHTALALAEARVYGAGFIAAVDLLSGARNHLSWWQGDDRGKLVLAAQSVNKEFIDYSDFEWYRVPMMTGASHVAGPHVDYLCSDEYTVTVAAPVHIDGDFVGVAGLDMLIDSVERQLMPRLSALDAPVTLVNGVGRVIVSTDAGHTTGDAVRGGRLAELARTRCAGVELDIILG
ncbi:cache domain-containing protein [Microterricola viridarii]|uniref:Cache domain-containing protein n=1 Tax=Microterricola viridarii TaxID=412690 RepID=A0A0Y0N9F0_9MICO|nr:cache domain-containing protein [Microterricola viridarii]AMB57636.1 hypothetical protein AWU67_00805 [Microterricola viridarii]